MQFSRKRINCWNRPKEANRTDLLGRPFDKVAPPAHCPRGIFYVEELGGEEDRGPKLMQVKFEARHNPEIPAASAHGPEQVSILPGAGCLHCARCRDDLGRDQI